MSIRENPNRFYNIPYLQKRVMDIFSKDDIVWIEEKIDGTNISCEVDENNKFRCYSRRFELNEQYHHNWAYNKLIALEDKAREYLGTRYIAYFEYLTKHHVQYSEDKQNGIYLIGIKDKETGKYLTPDKVAEFADKLGVEMPALFYHGPFNSWEIAQSLVGKSTFGAETGEGVIVKAYDNKSGIKMVKIVSEEFREIMDVDISRAQARMNDEINKRNNVKEIVTDARIRKQLYAMVDEGIISKVEGMSDSEKQTAMKSIGKRIYADCIKEEPEFVKEFGKTFGSYAFQRCRKFIDEL